MKWILGLARAVCSPYLIQTKQARATMPFVLYIQVLYYQWQVLIKHKNLAWTTDFLELFPLKRELVWVSCHCWKHCRFSHHRLCCFQADLPRHAGHPREQALCWCTHPQSFMIGSKAPESQQLTCKRTNLASVYSWLCFIMLLTTKLPQCTVPQNIGLPDRTETLLDRFHQYLHISPWQLLLLSDLSDGKSQIRYIKNKNHIYWYRLILTFTVLQQTSCKVKWHFIYPDSSTKLIHAAVTDLNKSTGNYFVMTAVDTARYCQKQPPMFQLNYNPNVNGTRL